MKRKMNKNAYLDRLAKVPMFRALAKRDLQQLGRRADYVTVDAGKVLTVEGDTGHEFFVIAQGRAVVKRNNRRIADLKKGDFFGELALLGNIPRNATVIAETDMDLYVLDRRSFSSLLREVPEIAVKLLKGLAQRLSDADAKSIH